MNRRSNHLRTSEEFIGESLEEKIRRATQSKEPIEAIAPMIYTERKDGVAPETNIRTDKWDVAQQAMTTIADGVRQNRKERMNAKPDEAAATGSEVNDK